MEKSANNVSLVSGLSVLVLIAIIIFVTLPLKFTLQQMAISLLGCTSLMMVVFALSGLFSVNHTAGNYMDGLHWLFIIMLGYLLFQLAPLPRSVIELLSPAMADLWNVDAYGFKGKAVLTADITGTIWFLITWCGYFFVFFLLTRYVELNYQFVLITLTIFLIGLYQIAFDQITKYLGYEYITAGQTDGHSYRLTGTFVNSNNLSALLNLSIASGFALIIYLKSNLFGRSPVLTGLLVGLLGLGELVLVYGLIKAGSAGGLLSLVAAVFLIALVLILRQFSIKVIMGLILFSIIMLLILTLYGSRELNINELQQNLSLSGRPLLWLSVVEMWKDFPVFGIGAGAFEWTFPIYKSDVVTPLRVFTAHSGYLHLAVETGLIGVVLGVSFALCYFKTVFAVFKKSQIHRYLVCSLMVGVLAFMIQECVEANLLIPPVAVLFFSILALTQAISKLNFEKREEN